MTSTSTNPLCPIPSSTAIINNNKRTARRQQSAVHPSSYNGSESVTADGISKNAGSAEAGGLGSLAAFAAQCQPCEKFDNLPVELKDKIWDLSLHPMTQRLVVVRYYVHTGRYHTTTPTPAQ